MSRPFQMKAVSAWDSREALRSRKEEAALSPEGLRDAAFPSCARQVCAEHCAEKESAGQVIKEK